MALDLGADLYGRSFLTLRDWTAAEIEHLLTLAARLKQEKREGREIRRLAGRNIALIFEKDSTRTRIGFEVAAHDQGAHVTYLGPSGSHVGKKESVKDTARVLGRVYDAIEFRGFHQADVETLARHAGVPVYNGLTDEDHPTQVLADLLTIREHLDRPLHDVTLAYVGDAHGNMGDELLLGCATMGLDFRVVAPRAVWPREDFLAVARERAAASGARITVTDDIAAGVRGADVVYTDVWVSMGEPETTWDERIALLRPYQVNAAMMAATGNPAARFMHCLPAFHDLETEVGRKMFERHGLTAMEVTDEVFESERSIVFDQAENRMHTIKAVLVATLTGTGCADARRRGPRRERAAPPGRAPHGREPAGEHRRRGTRPAADRPRARPGPDPRQRAAGGSPVAPERRLPAGRGIPARHPRRGDGGDDRVPARAGAGQPAAARTAGWPRC